MYRLSFARAAWKYFQIMVQEMEMERVQAVVLKGHTESMGWLEWMGFKFEGNMPKYLSGETYMRYAWIKEN
jgi:RimJ/RimL family protein N-acetyltransferase